MPSFNPYLVFDGTTAQAMPFYQRVLGGKLDVMTFAQMPDAEQQKMSAATADRVMHAMLSFDGGQLMASDTMEGQPYEGMKGFALTVNKDTAAEAEQVLVERGVLKPGDTYAITCGEPMGYPGGTNMLKVCRVA